MPGKIVPVTGNTKGLKPSGKYWTRGGPSVNLCCGRTVSEIAKKQVGRIMHG